MDVELTNLWPPHDDHVGNKSLIASYVISIPSPWLRSCHASWQSFRDMCYMWRDSEPANNWPPCCLGIVLWLWLHMMLCQEENNQSGNSITPWPIRDMWSASTNQRKVFRSSDVGPNELDNNESLRPATRRILLFPHVHLRCPCNFPMLPSCRFLNALSLNFMLKDCQNPCQSSSQKTALISIL